MCCGRRISAETFILPALFLLTSYSIFSFCVFIFPRLLDALGQAFLQPFIRGIRQPTSATPLHVEHLLSISAGSWGLFGVSAVLFSFTVWAYVAAATTDPGRVPYAYHKGAPKSATLALKVSGAQHHCPVCAHYKPQRAHHCSRCRRCVLKYDHHCPWIGRCVGFFNYKLYLLVIFYTFLCTLWVVLLLLLACSSFAVQHYEAVNGQVRHRRVDMPAWDSRKCWAEAEALDRPHLRAKDLVVSAQAVAQLSLFEEFGVCPPFLGVYVCFLEAFIFLILSGSLLRKHWGLARRNLTTLDLVIQQTQIEQGICVRPPVNPFDIGVKGNLHQVFGDGDADGEHIHANFIARWFCRLLPVAAYPEQEQLRYASSVSSERSALVSTDPALWAGGAQASIPNYGTLQKGDLSGGVGQVTVIEGRGVCNVYHLSQVSSHVGSLLGQTFPTAVPLTSPTPV